MIFLPQNTPRVGEEVTYASKRIASLWFSSTKFHVLKVTQGRRTLNGWLSFLLMGARVWVRGRYSLSA